MEQERQLTHPSDEELASFWSGTSSPEALERLAVHVDDCITCDARLETLEPAFLRYRLCLDHVYSRMELSDRSEEDLWKEMRRIDARRPRPRVTLRPAWLSGLAAAAACVA